MKRILRSSAVFAAVLCIRASAMPSSDAPVSFTEVLSSEVTHAFQGFLQTEPWTLRQYFELQGVVFAPGAHVTLDPKRNRINGRLTEENVELIHLRIESLNEDSHRISADYLRGSVPSLSGEFRVHRCRPENRR